jgi:hypothetical protein
VPQGVPVSSHTSRKCEISLTLDNAGRGLDRSKKAWREFPYGRNCGCGMAHTLDFGALDSRISQMRC